jgi:uncharacterized membrane protein YcaP (DUF421 family)
MDLVYRTVFVFVLIFVVTRAVGRRELSSMEPFDMILLVVIGLVMVIDGRVHERNLRRERMIVEELEAEARLQQIGSLDDVRFAVLETNGKISFATK